MRWYQRQGRLAQQSAENPFRRWFESLNRPNKKPKLSTLAQYYMAHSDFKEKIAIETSAQEEKDEGDVESGGKKKKKGNINVRGNVAARLLHGEPKAVLDSLEKGRRDKLDVETVAWDGRWELGGFDNSFDFLEDEREV